MEARAARLFPLPGPIRIAWSERSIAESTQVCRENAENMSANPDGVCLKSWELGFGK